MIPTKARENRRMKALKLSKNLERKYKEVKCRECSVVVTPMDFAKILGKFTKVKIQYESTTKPKPKHANLISTNTRLKAKENGMVDIHRQAFNLHPAQKLLGLKKAKPVTPPPTSNVLKENNRLKKPEKLIYSAFNNQKQIKSTVTYYGVVFDKPKIRPKVNHSEISLQELVTDIDKSILPAEDWCIDYFPKKGEPKDDKIYDKIAAELEDLMYNEKTKSSADVEGSKNDEFPSILDILNENTKDSAIKTKPASSVSLESSDVEAMLLGNAITTGPTSMEVDDESSSSQPITQPDEKFKTLDASIDDNPESPSILEEPLPTSSLPEVSKPSLEANKNLDNVESSNAEPNQIDENDNTNTDNKNAVKESEVTQIIFKKSVNGTCFKSVVCPKDMKYSISIEGKSVQLLGAPKHISNLEDLQVLLQIVEESDLNNLYVLH